MAFSINSGGYKGLKTAPKKLRSESTSTDNQQLNQSGLGSRLGQALSRGITNPIETGTNLLDLLISPLRSGITSLLPQQVQQQANQQISQFQNRQPLNPKNAENAPQGLPEDIAQRFLEGAPTAALFGPATLARSGAGSIVGGAARNIGASEGVSDLAQLGTEFGLGLLPSFGKIPTINSAQKSAQSVLENTKAEPFAASIIKNSIRSVEDKLGREADSKVKNIVTDAIETLQNNITNKKINPHHAYEIRHSIDKIGKKLSSKETADYIKPLRNGINDFFAAYSAENPTFYKNLTARDKLTQLKHMGSFIDNFADQLKSVPLLPKAIKYSLGGFKIPTQVIKGIATNSEARKHYFNVFKAAINNDPGLFVKNIENLGSNFMPEKTEAIKKEIAPSKGFVINKGGYKKG
jgi:hypothetical protein